MRRLGAVFVVLLLASLPSVTLAHGVAHGFQFDLGLGAAVPDSQTSGEGLYAVRMDYHVMDCWVATFGVSKASLGSVEVPVDGGAPVLDVAGFHKDNGHPGGGSTPPSPPPPPLPAPPSSPSGTTEQADLWSLLVGLEYHWLGYQTFDPYVTGGVGINRAEVDGAGDDDGFSSWHAGAGIDWQVAHGFALAFDGKYVQPLDAGELATERIEITAAVIIGRE